MVAVTDRTELDNQLADAFTGTHLAPACVQAEEITGGPQSLHELRARSRSRAPSRR